MDLQRRIEQLEREVASLRGGERRGELSLRGLGRRLERCQLTANLAAGGTAAAVLVDGDDVATTLAITVTDPDNRGPLSSGQIFTIWWRETPGGAAAGLWIPFDVGCCDEPWQCPDECCDRAHDSFTATFADDAGLSDGCMPCAELIAAFVLDSADPCQFRYDGIFGADGSYAGCSMSAELFIAATAYPNECEFTLDVIFGATGSCGGLCLFSGTVRYQATFATPMDCGSAFVLPLVLNTAANYCTNFPSQVTILGA